MVTTVFLAGYGNSTRGHWQHTWFEQTPNSVWVEQRAWDNPNREDWVSALDTVLSSLTAPVLIIAHSLGCNTFIEWCATQNKHSLTKITGALLVAYPDVLDKSFPTAIQGFSSPPLTPIPVNSLAIASTNDPYITFERAQYFADAWQIKCISAGAVGHINIASNINDWPEGKVYLAKFKNQLML